MGNYDYGNILLFICKQFLNICRIVIPRFGLFVFGFGFYPTVSPFYFLIFILSSR